MNVRAALPTCSILLLAGGRGQRMGGRDKGLIEWQGKAMIEHLQGLTRPLTDDLIISCNRNIERYAQYADQVVEDDDTDFNGPLAGIRAALPLARHQWLLVLPCDVPRVDGPLLQALREKSLEHPQRPVMVREGQHWQPLLCIIPIACAATLEAAWQTGERSPRRAMESLQPVAVQLEADDPRLANLNTPCLLAGINEHR
ncbi:molybdopterin-guanine dinucleotide biosynthesis protein A [Pseudomonas coronafaciens pv. porri]|uniref:Molybdenum cofactor guanylyltransferase n=1 Tax=Pseudomonas coronafaciens pv. porri TaxID=83964 RepID=A0ABR5JQU5_9PSED|nr:molybdenum cofactor guanylyltransferase MobA [Pseudomonas coronafaciens]KOP56584.1 molybdopterin-guanine dinucleotide biosynthesis protein A [Pseudomonas coronafaciens pv. porri]KOP59829.1 molybdopterin-guanine dinucleotide biosynthesis protein A [Pseudomonas coronafaciens pv. porri]KPY23271.1 Molybdopterin-guanine dinucleotide biosynthesis protein MobA [Pseudomonas coronafaciens pv. porri]RMU79507.1 Molybdopterin-guanine dinucleotide biosynthesis protein MobA [Pseudomonas coronafaciens pv. 